MKLKHWIILAVLCSIVLTVSAETYLAPVPIELRYERDKFSIVLLPDVCNKQDPSAGYLGYIEYDGLRKYGCWFQVSQIKYQFNVELTPKHWVEKQIYVDQFKPVYEPEL